MLGYDVLPELKANDPASKPRYVSLLQASLDLYDVGNRAATRSTAGAARFYGTLVYDMAPSQQLLAGASELGAHRGKDLGHSQRARDPPAHTCRGPRVAGGEVSPPAFAEAATIVLFCGRFDYQKGFDRLGPIAKRYLRSSRRSRQRERREGLLHSGQVDGDCRGAVPSRDDGQGRAGRALHVGRRVSVAEPVRRRPARGAGGDELRMRRRHHRRRRVGRGGRTRPQRVPDRPDAPGRRDRGGGTAVDRGRGV